MSDMDRMKSLLTSYYGVGAKSQEQAERDAANIDSSSFDVEAHAKNILLTSHLPLLLSEDDRLVQDVKALDADMQLLVYDNYSKFISATDTIRKMKHKVREIEGDIAGLVSKTQIVADYTTQINTALGDKRSKIERLVGLQGLIRKLNFLFDLPARLRESIANDRPQDAVQFYRTAAPFLERYAHVQSFAAIDEESREIVKDLDSHLESQLGRPDITASQFVEWVGLLVGLDNTRVGSLSLRFLAWQLKHLRSVLDHAFVRAVEPEDEVAATQINKFVNFLNISFLQELSNVIATYRKLFLTTASASSPKVDSDTKTESDADTEGHNNNDSGNKKEDGTTPNLDTLTAFTARALHDYFTAIRARFLQLDLSTPVKQSRKSASSASLLTDSFAMKHEENETDKGVDLLVRDEGQSDDEDAIGDNSDDIEEDEQKEVFEPMLKALGSFSKHLRRVAFGADIQRRIGTQLADRAAEITEHAIRHQVSSSFDALRTVVKSHIKTLLIQVANQDEDEGGRTENTLAQLASHVSKLILAEVDATLTRLKRLVRAGSTLLNEMSVVFDNVVNFHLFDWFLWLTEWMEQQGGARASSNTGGGENPGLSDTILPNARGALVLASLSKEIGEFVEASSLPMISDSSEVTNKLRQTTSLLVRAFVDIHASQLSAAVLAATENATWTKAPMPSNLSSHSVSQVVLDLLAAAARIAKEVGAVSGLENISPSVTPLATASTPPPAQTGVAVTAAGANNTYRRYTRNGAGGAGAGGGGTGRGRSRGGRGGSLELDVEKMFTGKLDVFGAALVLDRESVLIALFASVLKSLLECVRIATLSQFGYQQVQVDVAFLRATLPLMVDDSALLFKLLTEISTTSRDRSVEPVAMDNEEVSRICNSTRESAQLRF